MDAKTARETIVKPKLTDIFGPQMTNLLMTVAISAGMKGADEKDRFSRMVGAVCEDPRVVGMWGAAQANQQKQHWIRAGP
jgi:hypothetical protein